MKKQLTFYFIRHGKTVWNTEGLMQGHGDSPLTEEGVNGAKKTGMALNHIPFVAAYSSVLKRTIATASHIIGERDIPLFHHQGLNEQYFGSWEGKVVDTLREHPEFKQLIKDPANYKAQVNGGETFEQLGERAMKALQDEKINKVSLIAFTQNDIGNAFWNTIGWTERLDLNYYDFTLNEANITALNEQ